MRFAREIRLRRVKCASRVLECGLGSEMGFVCEVPGAFFCAGSFGEWDENERGNVI